jgi:hypothetical protein
MYIRRNAPKHPQYPVPSYICGQIHLGIEKTQRHKEIVLEIRHLYSTPLLAPPEIPPQRGEEKDTPLIWRG